MSQESISVQPAAPGSPPPVAAPIVWGQDIGWWNFRRELQVDYALSALFADSEREGNSIYKIWDLACEGYTPEQLLKFFEGLMASGSYSLSRLAHELHSSIDWRRDPAHDNDFPSVVALCCALRQIAKRRLERRDFSWDLRRDAQGGSAGKGWDDVTEALFSKLKKDAHGPTLDWMFAADLGL